MVGINGFKRRGSIRDMLTSLVDLLVEKGIITQEEYEAKVRSMLEESAGLTRFDDLEE